MATIHRIGEVKISLNEKDHNPPHVHVSSPDFMVLVNIRTGEVFRGTAPGKRIREALEWIAANRNELLALWDGRE